MHLIKAHFKKKKRKDLLREGKTKSHYRVRTLIKGVKKAKRSAKKKDVLSRGRLFRSQRPMNSQLSPLPNEVLNRIFSHVLIEPSQIEVNAVSLLNLKKHEPGLGLLSVCKWIRHEYEPMYYQENIFSFEVEDYNGAALAPFFRRASRHFDIAATWDNFEMSGLMDFEHVMTWLKLEHTGLRCIPDSMRKEFLNSLEDDVVHGAIRIVTAMGGSAWKWKHDALNAYFWMLGRLVIEGIHDGCGWSL